MDIKKIYKYKLPYIVFCAVLAMVAFVYLLKQKVPFIGIITALFSLSLFLIILWHGVIKLIQSWFSPEPKMQLTEQSIQKTNIKIWAKIALGVVAFHIFNYVFAYIAARLVGRINTGIFDSMYDIWCKCGIDAPSYLGIAENWYVTSGDPMYHIVFFPFYPLLIKVFWFVFRDYFVSAIFVSIVSSIGMAVTGYELIRLDYSEKTAKHFVIALFLVFTSFFYSAAMTESLFVFLSLLCLYFTRKRKFILAGLFGALCAFTRSPGVLLIVPVGIEYIKMLIEAKEGRKDILKLVVDAFSVIFISSGLLAYFYINYRVWGDAFQFSIFQKEHWGQQMGFFFESVSTITKQLYYGLQNSNNAWDWKAVFALWIPQLIMIFGGLGLIIASHKRIKAGLLWYFIVYFAFTIGATWLLSAPRYLMATIALPLAIAFMTEKNKNATGILIVLNISMLFAFAIHSPIY